MKDGHKATVALVRIKKLMSPLTLSRARAGVLMSRVFTQSSSIGGVFLHLKIVLSMCLTLSIGRCMLRSIS